MHSTETIIECLEASPVTGRRPKQTETERREKRRLKSKRWRAENLERAREITRESERRRAAARAIGEGREPGRVGRPSLLTPEEKRAKRKANTEQYNARNIEAVREKARIREAAKRAGTFVSLALPHLSDEERRLREVTFSAKRRARIRATGGKLTAPDVASLRLLQRGHCGFCLSPLDHATPHVDHFLPLALGGANDIDNLSLMHSVCNLRKGAAHPAAFGLVAPLRFDLERIAP